MWRCTFAVAILLFCVSALAGPEEDDELEFFAGAIETHAFLRAARGEPRSRSMVYQPDLQRLNRFLGEARPLLERWHGLYQAMHSHLSNRGYQISVDGAVGIAAGVGLRVGLGIEDRLLVNRPHLFLHGLWSFVGGGDSPNGGMAGVMGAITVRRYTNQDPIVGASANDDPEKWGAAVVGYGTSDASGDQLSLTAGVGGARLGASDLLVLELPAWLWPFKTRALKLLRRVLVNEFDLIHQVQRMRLADAESTLRRLNANLTALEKEVRPRLTPSPSPLTLSSAHPLAGVFALYSSSAVARYQGGALWRFLHRCGLRMGLED